MPEQLQRGQRRADVLYTVADNDGEHAAFIAYALNYPDATVRRDLAWLGASGYVRRDDHARWFVTDNGRNYLAEEAKHEQQQ